MKKLSVFLVFLFLSTASFAQTVLQVAPGYGTLNAAITSNQGNVIYQLQAGGWYTLNAQIENSGFNLTIIGTTPVAGQMPAVIQTATLSDGTVLGNMFDIIGNFTLKNVFLVNADANNTIGPSVITVTSSTPNSVVLDSITVDPVGTSGGFIGFGTTPNPHLYVTNSLFLRSGNLSGANDGWFFSIGGAPDNGFDTLYIENNTFMSTGTGIGGFASFTADSENFVWVNHNSFIFHKSQIFWAWRMNSYFVTNNLFFDFSTQPWNYDWNVFFPDGDTAGTQSRFALVNQDTASWDSTNGQLLSSRKLFVEYNSDYTDPRILAYPTTWAAANTVNEDGKTPMPRAYLMSVMYPTDSAGVNREAQMCSDKTHFPKFYEGNYLDNSQGTSAAPTDPQFTDKRFYTIQDSIYLWTLPAAELNTWGFNANDVNPSPSQIGNWFWNIDSVYNYGNPTAWPRVNAAYTSKTLINASIEGLPLGDLNWFPTQKAAWLKNQSAIMSHILSENTSPITLTGIAKTNNKLPISYSLSQNYPNPFNPTTMIQYSILKNGLVTLKVYNMLGQEVATLVNQQQQAGNYSINFNASRLASGVYMYRIQSGSFSLTKKMTLLK